MGNIKNLSGCCSSIFHKKDALNSILLFSKGSFIAFFISELLIVHLD